MDGVYEVISKIDFKELSQQRLALIEIAEFDKVADLDRRNKLSGLVNLLDALVDAMINENIEGAEDALIKETRLAKIDVILRQTVDIEVPVDASDADLVTEFGLGNYDSEIFEAIDINEVVIHNAVVLTGNEAEVPRRWEGTD